jgi:hypothetical protein
VTRPQDQSLEGRLAAVENRLSRTDRQNRVLKVCVLLVPAAFLLGAAAQRRDLDVGTLTADRFVLRGQDGKDRGRLEVDPAGNTQFLLLDPEGRPAFRVMAHAKPRPMTSLYVLSPEGKASVSAIAAGKDTSLAVRGPNQKFWFYLGKRKADAPPLLEVFDETGDAVVGKVGGK